jgi:CheY-like chemotaxis protein
MDGKMCDEMVLLLAEDRDDDILLIRKALVRADVQNPLFVVRDGEQTVEYLAGIGKYANRAEYPLPDLLLLDLKMPRMDGFEVLRWIRSQPALKALSIVVLTSSEDIHDVNKAYESGASSFLVKPIEFECYEALARTLGKYWLQYNRSPTITQQPLKPELPESEIIKPL